MLHPKDIFLPHSDSVSLLCWLQPSLLALLCCAYYHLWSWWDSGASNQASSLPGKTFRCCGPKLPESLVLSCSCHDNVLSPQSCGSCLMQPPRSAWPPCLDLGPCPEGAQGGRPTQFSRFRFQLSPCKYLIFLQCHLFATKFNRICPFYTVSTDSTNCRSKTLEKYCICSEREYFYHYSLNSVV